MFGFLKKLFPDVFEKRELVSKIMPVITEAPSLEEYLLGFTQSEQDGIGFEENQQKLNKLYNALVKEFKKQGITKGSWVSNSKRQVDFSKYSLFTNLSTIALALGEKAEILGKYIEKEFSTKIAVDGVTFKQAEVIKLTSYLRFAVDYLYKFSTGCFDDYYTTQPNSPVRRMTLLPGERKWLENEMGLFVQVVAIVISDARNFEQLLNKASDIIVAEVINGDGTVDNVATQGINTAPVSGFMPVIGSAIYSIGKWSVERDHKKYESNKARRQLTQLHIENLRQQLNDENPDPAIIKQIEYYTKLIQDLEASIYKYEEKIGVA